MERKKPKRGRLFQQALRDVEAVPDEAEALHMPCIGFSASNKSYFITKQGVIYDREMKEVPRQFDHNFKCEQVRLIDDQGKDRIFSVMMLMHSHYSLGDGKRSPKRLYPIDGDEHNCAIENIGIEYC